MVVLGTGDEEHAVAESGPGFGLGTAMVGEHDDADVGFLGRFEDRGASAFGVVGILGMDVEDSTEILIDAGRGRRGGADFHPFDTLRVDGGEMGGIEALDGGAGEEEGGKNKEGKDTHTFILRGWLERYHKGSGGLQL